jgi:hypothetical protein
MARFLHYCFMFMKGRWKRLVILPIAVTALGLRAQSSQTPALISAPPPEACNF